MTSFVAFESKTEKDERRNQLREQRKAILQKVEADYHKREEKKKRAELQGHGSWMLPSVADRISNSQEHLEAAELHHKRKKLKKEKKDKKQKKKHKKDKRDKILREKDKDSGSSLSQSDASPVWIEKPIVKSSDQLKSRILGPQLERESWMTDEMSFESSSLSSLLPSSRRKQEMNVLKDERIEKAGQHHLELNPYWKDGGTGLPETTSSSAADFPVEGVMGDGGLSWLKKSLQRCKEIAKEKNKSLEEIAAERFGSLEELQNRISAAEMKSMNSSSQKYASLKFRKPNEEDENEKEERFIRRRSDERRFESGNWRKKTIPCRAESLKISNEQEYEKKRTKDSNSEESEDNSNDESSVDSERENSERKNEDNSFETPLTEEEINQIGAQIVKAELLGNDDLAEQLKKKLENGRKCLSAVAVKAGVGGCVGDRTKSGSRGTAVRGYADDEVALLTRTDRSGMTRPLKGRQHPIEKSDRRRQKVEVTHEKSGKRRKYFADDDNYSLKDLVEKERLNTAEDSNMMFARLAGRNVQGDDEDMDDKMIDKAALKQSASLIESKERQMAIIEQKRMSASLSRCGFCFENVPKHLIVAVGLKVYLSLPKHHSLVDGHCFIVPIQHETQGTKCDEDVWDEIKVFQKGLTAMCNDAGKDCIFIETSMNLKRFPHVHIECLPVPKEIGEMAPIYFKKALQECESEWAQNKKIVDLSKRDVRQAIPKGFPYFSVNFGMDGGYAHVIEEEKSFSSHFGREVVGGMLELDATVWRHPHNEVFEEQRKKVLKFADQWKPYDWTKQIKSV